MGTGWGGGGGGIFLKSIYLERKGHYQCIIDLLGQPSVVVKRKEGNVLFNDALYLFTVIILIWRQTYG